MNQFFLCSNSKNFKLFSNVAKRYSNIVNNDSNAPFWFKNKILNESQLNKTNFENKKLKESVNDPLQLAFDRLSDSQDDSKNFFQAQDADSNPNSIIPNLVPRWLKSKENAADRLEKINRNLSRLDENKHLVGDSSSFMQQVLNELENHAALDRLVIDVSDKVDHIDSLILCTGRSIRHVYAIADSIRILAKNRYTQGHYMPPNLAIEGGESEEWLVLDLGKFMVHVFTKEMRAEMDIEGIWLSEPHQQQ